MSSKLEWSIASVILMFGVSGAHAQMSYELGEPAFWEWRASSDGGQSWSTRLIEVPQSQPQVIVQAWVSFPPAYLRFLAFVMLDGTVTGEGGVGPGDSVGGIFRGALPNVPQGAALRFGNVIKIDATLDTAPPGQGPFWYAIAQPGPGQGAQNFDNPLFVMQYSITLDGTPGDRLVDGVWRRFQQFPDGDYAYTTSYTAPTLTLVHPLSHDPLTIHVVPSPPAVILPAALALGLLRRRRRG